MNKPLLTKRQREVLQTIRRLMKKMQCPPTVRQLAHELDIQLAAVQGHLDALERKGALRRRKQKYRHGRIVLTDQSSCPFCGGPK